MIEENLNCLGHLSTIIHKANEEQSSKMMVSFYMDVDMCFRYVGCKGFNFPC